MTEDPRDDLVARQYRRWQYPEPVDDLEAAEAWDWFDPSHSHRIFWPDRPYRPEMDILVAGCGTNQAATIALRNPAARVVGIDISQESLDHGRYLKHKHRLTGLELHRLPIEEVGSLGRDFDLVVSSGVLHHMASAQAGLDALAGVLRPDGVAAIMLYARYGRLGVEMMQAVFREMGLVQDEQSLRLVRTGLDWLDPTHPARVYMDLAPDLYYDAGMVDTFLHGRDVSFTVQDCLDLVDGAGLVFQDWFHKTAYYPPTVAAPDNEFLAAIGRLPDRRMWSVMERLRNQHGCHLFTACRPERPAVSYRIDFHGGQELRYTPLWRTAAGLDGQDFVRPGWRITLAPAHAVLAGMIDGERSIGDIAAAAALSGDIGYADRAAAERAAVELFEGLWRMDFVAIDLGGAVC